MRSTFIDTAAAALRLLDEPAVDAAWSGPSALPDMTVGGLAAHLARAVLTVQGYLAADGPAAGAEVVDAAGYLLTALPDTARDSDINTQVLARAEAGGRDGADGVRQRAAAALSDLRRDLPGTPADHVLAVLGGTAIQLDDYLATRIVELVVHADDLAVSVDGIGPPALPNAGEAVAVRVLAEVARRRTSTAVMVTTLARRERAPAQVPRAF